MLVSMKEILDKAEEGRYGVGAFNVNNMEQLLAIMDAAKETESPVILQVSEGALAHSKSRFLMNMILTAAKEEPDYRHIPVAAHLDHGRRLGIVLNFISLGGTSVMRDGSLEEDGKTPMPYNKNVEETCKAVFIAHALGITVEGELGTLGGIEERAQASKVLLTDPAQAEQFVKETEVDALAIAIGNSHGAYKFRADADTNLAHHIIIECYRRLQGKAHLVMHGASSVPKEIVDIINQYCIIRKGDDSIEMYERRPGEKDRYQKARWQDGSHLTPNKAVEIVQRVLSHHRLADARGVPLEETQVAIREGMRKINIDTDGRLAFTAAVLESLYSLPGNIDQRKYLMAGREAIKKWVEKMMIGFGTAGRIADYSQRRYHALEAVSA